MMLLGIERILFSLTFNDTNEDKHHKSLGIAPSVRLQPNISRVFKQHLRLLRESGNSWSFGQ